MPKKMLPKMRVNNIQPFDAETLLRSAASSASTTVRLEAMSTAVLMAPIGSLRWTAWGVGQAGAPNRSTMYVPIRPAKNIISVDKNNHINVLPREMGKPGWYSKLG